MGASQWSVRFGQGGPSMAVAVAWLSRRLSDRVSEPCDRIFESWIGCDRSSCPFGSLRYVAHKQYGWIRDSLFGRVSGEAWRPWRKRSPRRIGDFRALVGLGEKLSEFGSELEGDRFAVKLGALQSNPRSFPD